MTDAVLTQAPQSPQAEQRSAALDAAGDARAMPYVTLFDGTSFAHEPAWRTARRAEAIRRFAELGFPTRRNEDWHFTNVGPIAEREFQPVAASDEVTVRDGDLDALRFDGEWETLVFVNGHFAPSLSTTDGRDARAACYVAPLSVALASAEIAAELEPRLGALAAGQGHAFTELNTAFQQDGACVLVRPNTVTSRRIHLLFVTDERAAGALVSPRTLVVLGHHAQATVVESYATLGDAVALTNAVSEAYLGDGARLVHYKIQREGLAAYHVASAYVSQGRDSHLETFSFAAGADLSRTNVSTVLAGTGAHATVNGLYMVDGAQTVDHQTRIEHAAESCTSHELYKGVLDGESHAVFNGKVYVQPEAQKTDGKQSNNNLLLSDAAHVDTKPQLEIFADDVKCTHGATVGRLDPTATFYLKSRGVGEVMARKLLTYAFAADVLEELSVDVVREALERQAFARFAGAAAAV
jgi:Fe-S cluster assembly protein SufD